MKRGINGLFWIFTVGLFGSPFFFYFLDHQQPITQKDILPNTAPSAPFITVYVAGDIPQAGVYHVAVGTKTHVFIDALSLTTEAQVRHLNLAKTLRDGQRLTIKKRPRSDQIININLCSKDDLLSLPGVGPSTAKKIMDHRHRHGPIQDKTAMEHIIGAARTRRLAPLIQY
jgi:competence protein ComEA